MTDKKPDSKKSTKSSFSATSRLLGSELRASLQTPPAEEPWRTKLSKGKSGGKRKK